MEPIGGAAVWAGAGARASAEPDEAARGAAVLASGGATRTGASTELPASLRGGGLGLAAAGGLGAGRDAAGGFGGGVAGCAAFWGAALPSGALRVVLGVEDLSAGALATTGERAASRLVWRCGALAGVVRLAEEAGIFGAGLRAAAAFGAGRFAEAAGLRRAGAAALPAGGAGRAGRFAAGLAGVFGRAAAPLRAAVACLAAAAAFFAFGAGRRDGLLTALPAEERFPVPLAGVDAFIRAISPSSAGHRERGTPSTLLRASPEDLKPAMPWMAEPDSASPSS